MKWGPSTEIQFLKGVGPAYAEILKKKGIYTFKDLIEYYPRTYQDLSFNKRIHELQSGENVSLRLNYLETKRQRIGRTRSLTTLVFSDGQEVLEAKFFKSPYRGYFDQFTPHCKVQVSGKVKEFRGRFEMAHPDISFLKDESSDESSVDSGSKKDLITPIYPESERLNQKKIRSLIEKAYSLIESEFKNTPKNENLWLFDPVPKEIKDKYKLIPRYEAIKLLHFPNLKVDNLANFSNGKTRAHLSLIFEEFFVLEVLTALRKQKMVKEKGLPITNAQVPAEFLKSIPFKLTKDQDSSLADIIEDFKKDHPMHRLVQGDVGSGKTLVALASAFVAIKQGFQVALMAPTEILAEQHLKNSIDFLEPFGIKCSSLTGSLKPQEKVLRKEQLRRGDIDFIVGTHALFEDDVLFKNLNFVIIDEQHRFGVHQRKRLKNKGQSPHFLVMTATPIPRTLTMTVYGDLEVSLIKTMPPGRTPVVTKKFFPKERDKTLKKVNEEISNGRQAYFVFPLVEESETLDLKSAVFEFEELKKHFKNHSIGLLHGKMRPIEKEEVMNQFRRGEHQVLVSTTVIEVGVDVPNSTVMVIENCERFGLSQLHQLRGRVGRGSDQSFCYLVLGNKFSKEGLLRAEIMESTTDGFIIAEEDLKLRGPGEVLGTRQSGLPEFKLADLLIHQTVLIEARKTAFDWVLKQSSSAQLQNFKQKYQSKLELGEVS